MNFEIINEYGLNDDYSYLNDLLDYAVKKLKIDGIFSVVFIDNNAMHEMNLKFRGIDRTTDVLSFALNDEESVKTSVNVLGDIFISIPKMKEQAKEYNHSEKRELSFLVIHGLLHLLGYDHQTKDDEKEMFNLQEEILDEKGIKK